MASKSIRNPDERFVDAVKAGIEKLAADLNVPLSMGMGLTKAYFLEKGKVQAKVTAAEFEAAYGEIKAMHRSQTDEKKVEASDNGRLPLSEGGQAEWDRGRNSRWFKKFSIQDIRDRFVTKIKGSEEVTEADLDTLAGEKDAEKASDLEAKGFLVIHGDASHDDVLEKAGIQKARGIFCVLGHDQENLLLTLAARGLNASVRIVTELHDGRFRERLTRCGADAVVDSPHIGGLRLASEMVRPITVGFLDSMIRDRSYTYRFEEVLLADASRLAGKAVSQLAGAGGRLPAVVAVKEKASGRYAINPDPGHTLAEGDVLVVLGSTDEIARLKAAV